MRRWGAGKAGGCSRDNGIKRDVQWVIGAGKSIAAIHGIKDRAKPNYRNDNAGESGKVAGDAKKMSHCHGTLRERERGISTGHHRESGLHKAWEIGKRMVPHVAKEIRKTL